MRSGLILLLSAALLSADVSAVPYVGYALPAGLQVGSQARVLIGGQDLRNITGIWVSGDGVTVTKVTQVPRFPYFTTYGYREWTKTWLDAVAGARHIGFRDVSRVKPDLPPAEELRFWPKCDWWERLDALDELEFALTARDLYTKKDTLQDIAALSQLLIADITVAADARLGTRDLIVYDNRGASAPHPFLVTSEPHAREPLFAPPGTGDRDHRVHLPPVVLDGRILPREEDAFFLRLTAGRRLVCELVGRELEPYIGDSVPGFFNPVMRLTDEKGTECAVADDVGYLPDPVLVFDVPEDGTYRLGIRDNLFRGRPDFVYSVTCRETDVRTPPPSVCERAFVCGHPAVRTEAPVETLARPGSSGVREIRVDKPGRWTFDLLARRLGSPLDGVLRLCSADGKPLAVWDDVTNTVHVGSVPQAECDPCGEWSFEKPGRYLLRVEDRIGQGGPDYRYALSAGPSRPSFEVYSEKSAFRLVLRERSKATFRVRVVRRNGFAGAIRLDDTEDFFFRPGRIPATSDVAQVTAFARHDDWRGVREVSFTASAVAAKGPQGVHVVPADAVEQAFAYSHLLPASAFRFLRPRKPSLTLPEWPCMPVDAFAPDHVVCTTAAFVPPSSAAAIDALSSVDVPVVPVPDDADDGLLLARFASACAHVTPPRRGQPVVCDPPDAPLSSEDAVRALLAGATRAVRPDLRYADGETLRVRTFGRAASLACDNDTLLLVPEGPLAPSFLVLARTLRDAGYCFDYVTAGMLTNAQVAARYRTLFVPKMPCRPPSALVANMLKRVEGGWMVLFEDILPDGLPSGLLARLEKGTVSHGKGSVVVGSLSALVAAKTPVRRETLDGLDRLRFVRFADPDGAWYFIHNPTRQTVVLTGRPAVSGQIRAAVAMDLLSGTREFLAVSPKGHLSLPITPNDAQWLYVTR